MARSIKQEYISHETTSVKSLIILIQGQVQGVGFRPWVSRVANKLYLNGTIGNTSNGIEIIISGKPLDIEKFILELFSANNPGKIDSYTIQDHDVSYHTGFKIINSKQNHTIQNFPVIPDRKTCDLCVKDLFDNKNRRYHYPFITCASCGPRFSILTALPFDRSNTAMVDFETCVQCEHEYCDINNKRFHAQTISCARCGPRLELYNSYGVLKTVGSESLNQIINNILSGQVVAIKGVGGYHMVCDATNDHAVQNLRNLKQRRSKPLAVMIETVEQAEKQCKISKKEHEVLLDNAAPIVLLEKKHDNYLGLSIHIANGFNQLGVLLPYTGLQYLLFKNINKPLVMTSCNISGRPIAYELPDVFEQFKGKVAAVLSDNRRIKFPCDDSVIRVINNQISYIRRARGYSLMLDYKMKTENQKNSYIAVGAHMKNTIAVRKNDRVYISPYLGDMETEQQLLRFKYYHDNLIKLLNLDNINYITDNHPDYVVNHWITDNADTKISIKTIQHHAAHAYAGLYEYQQIDNLAIFAWDGTGLGDNNEIWGGEVFVWNNYKLTRVASFDKFPLLGIDAAIKQPKRVALALLFSIYQDDLPNYWLNWLQSSFTLQEVKILYKMYSNQISNIQTSSCGRFFDAIAALLSIVQINDFDGHAPMALESMANNAINKTLPIVKNIINFDFEQNIYKIESIGIVKHIEGLILSNFSIADIAYNFHQVLANIVLQISSLINFDNILLTGGVFQNKILTELIQRIGNVNNKNILLPNLSPVNDGGISLGQIYGQCLTD